RCLIAGEDNRSRTIAEEARGDKAADRLITLLPRERTELDRQKERVLLRVSAHIIRRARDAGGAGHAAKAKDGRALDVSWEVHQVRQSGIDTRRRQAGRRAEKNRGDIRGIQARALKSGRDRLLAKLDRPFDPRVVCLAESREVTIAVDGKHQVTKLNPAVGMQAVHQT